MALSNPAGMPSFPSLIPRWMALVVQTTQTACFALSECVCVCARARGLNATCSAEGREAMSDAVH